MNWSGRDVWVTCLLGVLLSGSPLAASLCAGGRSAEALCGPNCLLLVCQRLGVTADIETLKSLCGYDTKSGVTMLALRDAAEAKGLHASGVKIRAEELLSLKTQCIALLLGSHFAVVSAAGTAGEVLVADSADSSVKLSMSEFEERYSGFALLIAKELSAFPVTKAEGPDLRFDQYVHDLGSVFEAEQHDITFRCRNVGTADVLISKIDASSGGCVYPIRGARTIAPGSEAEVKAILSTFSRSGRLRETLCVTSNDPVTPKTRLAVACYVRPTRLVTSPRIIDFGSVTRTGTAVRQMYVSSTSEEPLKATSVTCNVPYVGVSLAESQDDARPGYTVTATLQPGAPLGKLNATVTINSDHPKQPKAEVPVSAVILGNVKIEPERLYFGILKEGESRTVSVTVSTSGAEPLTLGEITNPFESLTLATASRTVGREYVITATLRPRSAIGRLEGEVVLRTSDPDQVRVTIPVCAFVRS